MSKVGLDGSGVARRNEERRAPTTPAQQRVLDIVNPCFSGFSAFVGGGSFEVFYHEGCSDADCWCGGQPTGWYWWSCWPGCLPNNDPSGPFPTAEGAYLDAIGE